VQRTDRRARYGPEGAVSLVRVQQSLFVVLCGELDIAVVDEVRSALREACVDPGSETIVVARGVSFIDCSVLGSLIELRDACLDRGSHWHLVDAPPVMRRLCELLDVNSLFDDDDPAHLAS